MDINNWLLIGTNVFTGLLALFQFLRLRAFHKKDILHQKKYEYYQNFIKNEAEFNHFITISHGQFSFDLRKMVDGDWEFLKDHLMGTLNKNVNMSSKFIQSMNEIRLVVNRSNSDSLDHLKTSLLYFINQMNECITLLVHTQSKEQFDKNGNSAKETIISLLKYRLTSIPIMNDIVKSMRDELGIR